MFMHDFSPGSEEKCIGFQHYRIAGGSDYNCFIFKE